MLLLPTLAEIHSLALIMRLGNDYIILVIIYFLGRTSTFPSDKGKSVKTGLLLPLKRHNPNNRKPITSSSVYF